MNQILRGEPLTVFGDGSQRRAFSYVGDIIHPIAIAPTVDSASNEIFNIGADNVYSVTELADAVATAMGNVDPQITYLEARDEVHTAFSDHSKAVAVFGEHANTSLDTGLAKIATWVSKVGARATPIFENIEIKQKLPRSWASAVNIEENSSTC